MPRVVLVCTKRTGDAPVPQRPVVRLVAKQTSRRSNGVASRCDDEASNISLVLHGFVQALPHVYHKAMEVVVHSPSRQSCISLGGK